MPRGFWATCRLRAVKLLRVRRSDLFALLASRPLISLRVDHCRLGKHFEGQVCCA